MTTLDYTIVVAYLVALFIIDYRASFGGQKKTDDTLFLSQKSLGWSSIGFNMWGTNVGSSMLLAFASVGFSTGIVAVNFDYYAFIFLLWLVVVFAPRYIAAKVSTMPEFMGNRKFDQRYSGCLCTHQNANFVAFAGLVCWWLLVRQIIDIPMWQSIIVLVTFAGIFTFAGGLKAVAKVNILQMLLLIGVSLMLSILGVIKVGGLSKVFHAVLPEFWNMVRPASDLKISVDSHFAGLPGIGQCLFLYRLGHRAIGFG